jgi:aminoglycoside 6'-N-acetyltransferase
MIVSNGEAVGYVRWQVVSRESLDSEGLFEIPDGSVDVDILIGERGSLAKGVGPAALELLVARLAAAPLIGLTTSRYNTIAQRAFHKAGFRFLLEYSPPPVGECHLMVLRPGETA